MICQRMQQFRSQQDDEAPAEIVVREGSRGLRTLKQGNETLNFIFKVQKYGRLRKMDGWQLGTLGDALATDMIVRLWHYEAASYLSGSMTREDKSITESVENR